MSLKAIEMQIALPKTFEAGKVMDQTQTAGQLAQSQAAFEMEKESERKRKSVVENNAKREATLDNEGSSDKNQEELKRSGRKNNTTVTFNHPYKGKTVDYSG
jgi:hypothetical protein